MTPPEDQSLGQRIVLTVIICLAVLFFFAIIGWLSGAWDEARGAKIGSVGFTLNCDLERGEHTRGVLAQALDEGLKEHFIKLFHNWAQDPTDQPARAQRGFRNTLLVYNILAQRLKEVTTDELSCPI